MQKLTSKQLEIMQALIEKRNDIKVLSLNEYLYQHYFNNSVEWHNANNNIVNTFNYKYILPILKRLQEKHYIDIIGVNAIYIFIKILSEV